MTKFLNISTDNTLGGVSPSDSTVSSQKAVKDYIDAQVGPSGVYHPDLFDWKWADHELNDMAWLRSDTFSWQDGGVYEAAYNHLVDDMASAPHGEWSTTTNSGIGSYSWVEMVWDGTKFIALSYNGHIATSPDGSTWTLIGLSANLMTTKWTSFCYTGSQFVALGEHGYISTSTDGITWSTPASVSNLGDRAWREIIWNGSSYIAVADRGYISTSTNGTSWTAAAQKITSTSGNTIYIDEAIYANGKYYAFFGDGGFDCVSTSTDGTTWSTPVKTVFDPAIAGYTNFQIYSCIWTIGRLFAIATGRTWTSTDGINWALEEYVTPAWDNNAPRFLSQNSTTLVGMNYEGYVSTRNSYTYETISGVTIRYSVAADGHKICTADQESSAAAIYAATGVAWYYVLDTVNQRFKLPRAKHNKYESTLGVVGNGMTLGLTDGQGFAGLQKGTDTWQGQTFGYSVYGTNVGTTGASWDHSNTKSWGVTSDPTKSGMVAQQEQDTDQYKYLYFYVGNFTQTALENTAGLNAELFNGKADLNLANVLANIDFVVERQEPTAANNYTWYRKYRSGWVEQGGWCNNTGGTITFPIAMSLNNQYTAILVHNGNTAKGEGFCNCYNKTSTGMSYGLSSSTSGMAYVSWQVSGMSA